MLRIVTGLIVVVAMSACAAQRETRPGTHNYDSYSGWVRDATSGKPIEGAVVVAVWSIQHQQSFAGIPGIKTYEVIRLEEAVTDSEGRFGFAPMGQYRPPLGWERAQFPTLLFFKPGYEPKGLGRTDWEYGEDYSVPRTEPTRIFRKVGWQREIPLYPYLTRPLTEIEAADPGQN